MDRRRLLAKDRVRERLLQSCGKDTLIPLNDFARQWQEVRESVLQAVEGVGRSGWYILGREVAGFETALAEYWGLPEGAGVGSGLDAIELSLRALGCGQGDKVLTTPLSAFATTLAILKIGAVPVFADTDAYGLLDLDQCREILRSRSGIRFLVPVHLYGHALDMRGLQAIARDFDCRIVEDCAQSIGASHNGIATGTAGRMAATSFYPTKNLGALGDGGAVLTGDPELARMVRSLRDYGQNSKYRHDVIGYNSRLDELQAAILHRALLPRLPVWTARRREIAERYLGGIRNPALRVPGAPPGSDSCWHLFPVFVESGEKAEFRAWMESRGVASGEHYPIAVPDQPAMQSAAHELATPIETARRLCGSEVSLPMFPYLTEEEIDRVIEACNEWKA